MKLFNFVRRTWAALVCLLVASPVVVVMAIYVCVSGIATFLHSIYTIYQESDIPADEPHAWDDPNYQ